jgi:hypothetical protein
MRYAITLAALLAFQSLSFAQCGTFQPVRTVAHAAFHPLKTERAILKAEVAVVQRVRPVRNLILFARR